MSQLATELRMLIDDVITERRDAATSDDTLGLWSRLRDLELPRVGIPEDLGGSGGTLGDLLVVVEALATHGVGVPIVEASVADWVLSHDRPLDERLSTIALERAVTGHRLPVCHSLFVVWSRRSDLA